MLKMKLIIHVIIYHKLDSTFRCIDFPTVPNVDNVGTDVVVVEM